MLLRYEIASEFAQAHFYLGEPLLALHLVQSGYLLSAATNSGNPICPTLLCFSGAAERRPLQARVRLAW